MSRAVSFVKTQQKEQDSSYFHLLRKESNKKYPGEGANTLEMGISKSSRGRMQEKLWSIQEQTLLYELHQQLGNRWSEISNHFQDKSDNDIKNHLFSRLRLSIRHLNKRNAGSQTKKTKEIKSSLLYRLVSICEERFRPQSRINKTLIAFCFVLKKQLINFLYQHQEGQQATTAELIAKDFELLNLICKNANAIGKHELGLLAQRMEREDCLQQLEPILNHAPTQVQVKQEQISSPIVAEQPTKQQVLESQHTHQLFFQLVSSGHHEPIPAFIRSTTPDENDLISQLQKFQLSFLPPLSSVPEEMDGEFNDMNLYYDFFNESQSPSI